MSATRFDTGSWLPGATLFGGGGFGVRGDAIAATGGAGPGYAYNDLALPADAAKEISGRITTQPASGVLVAYEDTSFTFTGPNGTYSFQYQLYVDGAAVGAPTAVNLSVGSQVATNDATGSYSVLSATSAAASVGLSYLVAASVQSDASMDYRVGRSSVYMDVNCAYLGYSSVRLDGSFSYSVNSLAVLVGPSIYRVFVPVPRNYDNLQFP